jgi:hypothetical protein
VLDCTQIDLFGEPLPLVNTLFAVLAQLAASLMKKTAVRGGLLLLSNSSLEKGDLAAGGYPH